MSRARRQAILGLVAIATAAAVSLESVEQSFAQPRPEAVDEAKRRYERGVELFRDGADSAALVELERAYALVPNYRILYNLGLVQLQLNDFVGALKSFNRYLRDGGREVPDARKTEVQGRLSLLRTRVATVDIQSNQPDTDIALDDVPIGKTPFADKVLINPGHRRITASKAGFGSETQAISAAGADTLTVTFDLKEVTVPPPPVTVTTTAPTIIPLPPPPPPRPPPPAPSKPYLWIPWTVTAVAAAGMGIGWVVATVDANQLSTARSTFPGNAADIKGDSNNAKTWAAFGDVCGAVGVVALAVSLYLTLKPSETSTVSVNVGPGSLAVRGVF